MAAPGIEFRKMSTALAFMKFFAQNGGKVHRGDMEIEHDQKSKPEVNLRLSASMLSICSLVC